MDTIFNNTESVTMEKIKKYPGLKNQDLFDKLIDLAGRLCAGRKTDPDAKSIRNQLEAIQVEIQTRKRFPGDKGNENEAAA